MSIKHPGSLPTPEKCSCITELPRKVIVKTTSKVVETHLSTPFVSHTLIYLCERCGGKICP